MNTYKYKDQATATSEVRVLKIRLKDWDIVKRTMDKEGDIQGVRRFQNWVREGYKKKLQLRDTRTSN